MKFFQTLIASTIGVFIAFFIISILFIITLASTTEEPEPYVRNNSVLKIPLRGDIPARAIKNPFDQLLREGESDVVSLESLRSNLKKAARHEKIKGLWLDIDFVSGGWANLQEAHRLISSFRDSSRKFVYASTNDRGYNEKGYYLATAADSIFSPAESFFEFDGFYSQVAFYTGLFDKVGIEAEVARHGKYKSAVEPFYKKELSEESRYQLNQILEDVSRTFVDAVGRKTGKSSAEINGILNSPPSLMARNGYEQGLIDSLLQPDEVESLIRDRIGLDETGKLNTITNARYARVRPSSAGLIGRPAGNKIAVIYANGPITFEIGSDLPWSDRQYITAGQLEEQLNQVRNDEDVKALVLRINSPGGSASTSDLIWNKLRDFSNRMPVIASMGPVAASGGYYIAMAADSIVAEPTTITGSIGVFATKFNTRQLWNEKLGVTFDEVKSHEHADWLNPTRGLTDTERKAYQQFVDRFYDTFISKVALSRGLTREQVDRVAQGRVWTGEDARRENLVDILGGMEEAVRIAAKKAGVSEYEIEAYPKPKDLLQLFMGSAQARIKNMLGETFFPYNVQSETIHPLFRYGKGDPLLIFPYELEIH